ncbi:hypothetical protein Syun_022135 [Stephania yunnanensis]|uniref:Uncharacterized protein n=1 Tax=Stephania yunnanensis TaxID=152371 RepID=A0AAP0IHX5_9MAGN
MCITSEPWLVSLHTNTIKSPGKMEFPIRVGEAELVGAAGPTPREIKYLSNIDDQMSLRHHLPFVHFFGPNHSTTRDPSGLIKLALSRTLVYYYPLSGRLRISSSDEGKLVVDCCDEGVMFREADADISLEKLMRVEGGLKPPFPQWESLLVDDVWGNDLIVGSPLLRIQNFSESHGLASLVYDNLKVTRLSCGGFVLAYTLNHCACDTNGALQFMKTIAEFCCDDPQRKTPSTLPSWGREILKPRSPPIISFRHPEYNNLDDETPGNSV